MQGYANICKRVSNSVGVLGDQEGRGEMSERRFVITDQGSGMSTYWYQRSITESELDNRLIAIYKLVRWGLPEREGMFLEKAKNILLNGVVKEEK